jgi:hypothetical protein
MTRDHATIRALIALLAASLLSVGAGACGATSDGAGSHSNAPADAVPANTAPAAATSATEPSGSYLSSDGDSDNDDRADPSQSFEKTDTLATSTFGREMSATERPAVVALIKRYYAAAAADDGALACPLLDPTLATGLGERQSQGQGQGHAAQSHGGGCAAAVSALFNQQHTQLMADEVATMSVIDVHVQGNEGIVTVAFRNALSGRIPIRRQGRAWKLGGLFDIGTT